MSDAGLAFWAAMGGGLLAGIFSLGAVWLSNRASANREAKRLEHEAQMAAEIRHQARIERAYLHLLGVVNEAWAIMERDNPTREPVDYEGVNDRVESVFAEMDAFGSKEVTDIFSRWRLSWGPFKRDVHNARVRAASGTPDRYDLQVLEGHRTEARDSAKQLVARVAAELRGPGHSHPGDWHPTSVA